jgi:hypothetical protein
MPIQDQAVWASVNVPHPEKGSVNYKRGELLPDPASDEEAAARSLLRLGGALRTVEVVYTPEELASQATARAELAATASAAYEPDPQAGEHPPTLTSTHGSPVVIGPPGGREGVRDDDTAAPPYANEPGAAAAELAGTPVAQPVVTPPGGEHGDEHGEPAGGQAGDEAGEQADGEGEPGPAVMAPGGVAPRRPAPNASKTAWVEYAVASGQADRGVAESMSRDQLAAQFGR